MVAINRSLSSQIAGQVKSCVFKRFHENIVSALKTFQVLLKVRLHCQLICIIEQHRHTITVGSKCRCNIGYNDFAFTLDLSV